LKSCADRMSLSYLVCFYTSRCRPGQTVGQLKRQNAGQL